MSTDSRTMKSSDSGPVSGGHKGVVLVIDDEEAIREFLRFVLERTGYIVVEAENGDKGLRLCSHFHIDIMITDLVMPGKEGLETIRTIKERHDGLKIVAMSGAVNSETYLKVAQGLGAHQTLQKPFSKNQLIACMERLPT